MFKNVSLALASFLIACSVCSLSASFASDTTCSSEEEEQKKPEEQAQASK